MVDTKIKYAKNQYVLLTLVCLVSKGRRGDKEERTVKWQKGSDFPPMSLAARPAPLMMFTDSWGREVAIECSKKKEEKKEEEEEVLWGL